MTQEPRVNLLRLAANIVLDATLDTAKIGVS